MLWGLTALAVPILVHLFNFRRFKKMMFSNVSFLKEIKLETQSKSKLKHLLILLTRMLALTAIVLAFAQPYIPQPGMSAKPGNAAVSIYIDNSFSMQTAGRDGALIDLAKNKALEIVEAFSPSDKFQLLTGDFEGRHQRLVSKEEMTELIQSVEISPVSRKLSEVISRQRDVLVNSGVDNKRAFVLTDLQASVTDPEAVQNDTSIRVTVVPELPEIKRNIFIDSVWFETPVRQLNQPEVLHIRLYNTGDEIAENLPVQLLSNGVQKSVATATIPPRSHAEATITYTNTESGFKHCALLIDDASITKDDSYYFSYTVAEKIRVLEIKGTAATENAVSAVFSDDPFYTFTQVAESGIDFGLFSRQDFIIINQLRGITSGLAAELDKFVRAGGSALIIPASEIIQNEYNSLLGGWKIGQLVGKSATPVKVNAVNYEHFIFKEAFQQSEGNVDLPWTQAFYEVSLTSSALAEPMMTLQTGSPFMLSGRADLGRIYLIAASLNTDESNFIRHAFFPATLVRMAEFSQPSQQLAYVLGSNEAVVLRNLTMEGEQTFRLKHIDLGAEVIPEHRNAAGQVEIFVHGDLQQAGNYMLSWGDTGVQPLAFNYNRAESYNETIAVDAFGEKLQELQFANWSMLEGDGETVASQASRIEDGKKYWLTLIMWALIFLAIEILLIKFWR